MGIDLGGTKIEGVVMDANGEILRRLRVPTPSQEGYDAILNALQMLVADLETKVGKQQLPIGMGTPGSLSPKTGAMRNSNTTCLNGRHLLQDLQAILNRPIRIANDANCFALSEATDGAGSEAEVVFGVIMGTGVGAGIVVQKQIIQGAQHIAGEWGHNPLTVDELPPRHCYCGRQNCVETFLSGAGIRASYQHFGGVASTPVEFIVTKSQAGDKKALKTMSVFHDHFGRAIASVVNILDPNIIVLGGGLSNIASLYKQGYEAMLPHIFSDTIHARIVANHHGDSSGVRGAAWLADTDGE